MKTLKLLLILFMACPCFARPPRYLSLTLGINVVNDYCNDPDWNCQINTYGNVNQKYVLTRISGDEEDYCWFTLTRSDASIYSTRLLAGSQEQETASGVDMSVNVNLISRQVKVCVSSTKPIGNDLGYCEYYYAVFTSDWLIDVTAGNQLHGCGCTPCWGIPPWTAGIGGTARIESRADMPMFSSLAKDWQSSFDMQGLADFCEQWKGEE
jgi:hypothetical protein